MPGENANLIEEFHGLINDRIDKPDSKPLYKNAVATIISLALALYWVIFLWNFWESGPFALGINAAIFLLAIFALLYQVYPEKKMLSAKNLVWLVPLALSILGNIGPAITSYLSFIKFKDPTTGTIVKKVIIGLFLFTVISLLIIVPFLSGAARVF